MKTRDELLLSIEPKYKYLHALISDYIDAEWLNWEEFLRNSKEEDIKVVDDSLHREIAMQVVEDNHVPLDEWLFSCNSDIALIYEKLQRIYRGLDIFKSLNKLAFESYKKRHEEVQRLDSNSDVANNRYIYEYLKLQTRDVDSLQFFVLLCYIKSTSELLKANGMSALVELAKLSRHDYTKYQAFIQAVLDQKSINKDQLQLEFKENYDRTPEFKALIDQLLLDQNKIHEVAAREMQHNKEYPALMSFVNQYQKSWMKWEEFLESNPGPEKLAALNKAFIHDGSERQYARVQRYITRGTDITFSDLANCSDPAMMITLLQHVAIKDVIYNLMQHKSSEELTRAFDLLHPTDMSGAKPELAFAGNYFAALLKSYNKDEKYKAEADLFKKNDYQAMKDLMRISLDDMKLFEKLLQGLAANEWKEESDKKQLANELLPYMARMPAFKAYIEEAVKGSSFAPILAQAANPVEPERVVVLASSSRSSSRSGSASSFSSSIFQDPPIQPEADPAFLAIIDGIKTASQNRLRSRFSIFVLAHRERENSFQKALDFITTPAELRQLIESQINRYHNNQSDLPKCLDANEAVKQRLSRPIHNRIHGYHGYWHFLQESQRALQVYEEANPTHRIFHDTL